MMTDTVETRSHYNALLARKYAWMAGGFEANVAQNSRFFADHAIRPSGNGIAIDLGAGCGFQSIALASAGFKVTAVDFSQEMLDMLSDHTMSPQIRGICADLLAFEAWAGRGPELIVCMGDTLTHLTDTSAAQALIRHCTTELAKGGRLVFSFRDYAKEPEETPVIIPVRRDPDRIFVCRLDYSRDTVRVTDIIYAKESGTWTRGAGSYPKLRLAPEQVACWMNDEGLIITEKSIACGMTTLIAGKPL
jgi:SAM-dependent methyltransferase